MLLISGGEAAITLPLSIIIYRYIRCSIHTYNTKMNDLIEFHDIFIHLLAVAPAVVLSSLSESNEYVIVFLLTHSIPVLQC